MEKPESSAEKRCEKGAWGALDAKWRVDWLTCPPDIPGEGEDERGCRVGGLDEEAIEVGTIEAVGMEVKGGGLAIPL